MRARAWRCVNTLVNRPFLSLFSSFNIAETKTERGAHQVEEQVKTTEYIGLTLPVELIGHIFSFLRGDKSALEECSKAHPIFSSIAEEYLYADILIRTDYKTTLSELYKQLSENPYILNFPRTFKLEFRRADGIPSFSPLDPEALLIISMLPRMANLVSLSIADQWPYRLHEDFMSTFKTCLQQSTIEELCLKSFRMFPLSILDGKTIKKLTLFDCTAVSEDEPILTSDSLHQSLEILIIKAYHNRSLYLWASRRATNLKTLELQDSYKPYLREFANLLRACSKTLIWLHLDIARRHQSIYRFNRQSHSYGLHGRWIGDHQVLPFNLSAHRCLKKVSISAQLHVVSNARIYCALPAVLQLIQTAPSIPVILSFHRDRRWGTSRIDPLNLSPLLDRIRSDFPPAGGVCPRIDLHIEHDLSDCLLDIPDVLETTDV